MRERERERETIYVRGEREAKEIDDIFCFLTWKLFLYSGSRGWKEKLGLNIKKDDVERKLEVGREGKE